MRFKRAVKKTRKFNAAQKEGLLRILDGTAQAFIIGATVGSVGFLENEVSPVTTLIIVLAAFTLILIALAIRGLKE